MSVCIELVVGVFSFYLELLLLDPGECTPTLAEVDLPTFCLSQKIMHVSCFQKLQLASKTCLGKVNFYNGARFGATRAIDDTRSSDSGPGVELEQHGKHHP